MLTNQSSIKHVILGLLNQSPQSGYDLKKTIMDSSVFFWSGNNNQIYTSLASLYRDGMVSYMLVETDGKQPRKIYSITQKGAYELDEWLMSAPELPEVENIFMIKLYLSDHLDRTVRQKFIEDYYREVKTKLLMLKEEKKRGSAFSQSAKREKTWALMMDNLISFYENEIKWLGNI